MSDDTANADPPVPTKKRRRRWFQFSLRSLMIFVTLVALFCQFVVRPAVEQRRIVSQLHELGATVGYDHLTKLWPLGLPQQRSWLDRLVGIDLLHSVTAVRCSYSQVGKSLRLAMRLPHVELIDLSHCDVTDNDLSELRDLKTLRELRLEVYGIFSTSSWRDFRRERAIIDAGLANLETLVSLETLSLQSRARLTDAGLEHLAKMNSLRSLDLGDTSVSGAGLAHLRCQGTLTELDLCACRSVGDSAMKHVARFKSLRKLNLGLTKVTDAGLAELENLDSLQELDLQDCHVTDAGMVFLGKLRSLRRLNVGDACVTDVGLRQLEAIGKMDQLNVYRCSITQQGVEEVAQILQVREWVLPQEWQAKVRLPKGQSVAGVPAAGSD